MRIIHFTWWVLLVPALWAPSSSSGIKNRESIRQVHHHIPTTQTTAGAIPHIVRRIDSSLLLHCCNIVVIKEKMLGALSRVSKKSLAAHSLSSPIVGIRPALGCLQQKRFLNVHEYISMELMASHGIQVPECHVAESTQEVEHIFNTSFHHKRKCLVVCWIFCGPK